MPLFFVRNDISKMNVDAIVNPANRSLSEGSGTSYAIYKAAGEDALAAACQKIGHCELGHAVYTEGFSLCKYIIHTVGPVYDDGYSNEEKILRDAYSSAMEVADKLKCESVALPLLSAGNYGFPKDIAMRIAVSAIQEFLWTHNMMVYLVLYDSEAVRCAKRIAASVEEYITDSYVQEHNEDLAGDGFFAEFLRYQLEIRRKKRNISNNDSHTMPIEEKGLLYEYPMWGDECNAPSPEIENYRAPRQSRFADSSADTKKKTKVDFKLPTIEELIGRKKETFSEMLLRFIDERHMKDSEVYDRACLSKQHFNKIKNKKGYTPKKTSVFCLALALHLNLDETTDLMAKAGHAFSDCSKTDIIVRYYIEHGVYDLFEINEVLDHYHLEPLGGVMK